MIKTVQKIIKYAIIGLVSVALLSIAISVFLRAKEVMVGILRIPQDAVVGLEPKSYKLLGSFKLSDWAKTTPENAFISVFQGKLAGSGKVERRAFYDDGTNTRYIGPLSDHFGVSWLKTVFVDFGGERSIVGWVSSDVKGKLYVVRFERPESVNKNKSYASKESTIESNMFIVPVSFIEDGVSKTYGWLGDVGEGEDPDLWNSISMIAVQTKESLQRGFDSSGTTNESYYEVEKIFDPAIDVSGFYIKVPI